MVAAPDSDTLSPPGKNLILRWDLKDKTQFPQWEMGTLCALRQVMPWGFLDSTRPTKAELESVAGVKRTASKALQQDATLRKLQEQWDTINIAVYETIEERLDLAESDVLTVRFLFGDKAPTQADALHGIKL